MEVKFVWREELNLIYNSGALCTIYTYPYTTMPKDFEERELMVAEEVEEAAKAIWGAGVVLAEYNTWADTTTRISIPQNLISDRFLDFCYLYVEREQGKRCISCTVVVSLEDTAYVGAFCVHIGGVLIEKKLEQLWLPLTSKWKADFSQV